MFGSGAIDVAIGLVFVFALLSLICSSLTEMVSQLLRWRATTLEKGVRSLIADQATRDAFYDHPLIRSLGKETEPGENKHPAYIPTRLFALVLLDVLAPPPAAQRSANDDAQVAGDVRRALSTLTGLNDAALEAQRKNVELWFDDVMDRVSGWYKRKAQWTLLVFAVLVTSVANVDCINLATTLWQSPALRTALADSAASYQAGAQANPEQKETLDELQARLDKLSAQGLPLGWAGDKVLSSAEPKQWLTKVAGLLLTALAVSLGAPFWFDLVNKLVNIRSAGKIPPPSEKPAQPDDEPKKK